MNIHRDRMESPDWADEQLHAERMQAARARVDHSGTPVTPSRPIEEVAPDDGRNKPFDHRDHCEKLEEAARELRRLGKDSLAAAVERARVIHMDMEGRIAQATSMEARIRRAADNLNLLANDLGRYTNKPDAPWIGTDLFPRE